MNVKIPNNVYRSCKAQMKFIIFQHISVYLPTLREILQMLMEGTQFHMYTEIQIKYVLM